MTQIVENVSLNVCRHCGAKMKTTRTVSESFQIKRMKVCAGCNKDIYWTHEIKDELYDHLRKMEAEAKLYEDVDWDTLQKVRREQELNKTEEVRSHEAAPEPAPEPAARAWWENDTVGE